MAAYHTFHLRAVIWPIARKQGLKFCSRIAHLGPWKLYSLLEKDSVESQTPFDLSFCCSAMLQANLWEETFSALGIFGDLLLLTSVRVPLQLIILISTASEGGQTIFYTQTFFGSRAAHWRPAIPPRASGRKGELGSNRHSAKFSPTSKLIFLFQIGSVRGSNCMLYLCRW